MTTTYEWKSRHSKASEIVTTDAIPKEYKGYLIFERIKGIHFDIVKDGVCLGMYAGPNGARARIDEMICGR